MADPQNELRRLLARTALHDRAAFAELYDRTAVKLTGVALRICASRAEAEEVVQIAYLKVWRSADRFNASRASPIAWMAAITRHAAIDRRRAEASRGGDHAPLRDPNGPEATEIVDSALSPEDAVMLASDLDALHGCLNELDESHAEAIRRAYLDGLSYREIAGTLGVPENTIKTWVRRSLVRLRECLNRMGLSGMDDG